MAKKDHTTPAALASDGGGRRRSLQQAREVEVLAADADNARDK